MEVRQIQLRIKVFPGTFPQNGAEGGEWEAIRTFKATVGPPIHSAAVCRDLTLT